jgi:hypothetical protein
MASAPNSHGRWFGFESGPMRQSVSRVAIAAHPLFSTYEFVVLSLTGGEWAFPVASRVEWPFICRGPERSRVARIGFEF